METLQNRPTDKYSLWEFKGYDDFIDRLPLMSSPFPVLLIFTAYLLFVLKLGPEYMKKRPPFVLNNVLLVYNILQVAISVFVFFYASRLLLRQGILNSVCELNRKNIEPLAIGMFYYLTAKLFELLDTVFFVLRKKDNQVTFLHVYHHAVVMIVTWFTLKYEPTYTIIFLGTLNTFVHIVMYSYYALSTFPSLTKYLWWKKYITTLQLVQFFLSIVQLAAHTYVTGCPPSKFLSCILLFNLVLMTYLFNDFYVKSYTNDKNRSKSSKQKYLQGSELKFQKNFQNTRVENNRVHEKTH